MMVRIRVGGLPFLISARIGRLGGGIGEEGSDRLIGLP